VNVHWRQGQKLIVVISLSVHMVTSPVLVCKVYVMFKKSNNVLLHRGAQVTILIRGGCTLHQVKYRGGSVFTGQSTCGGKEG